MERMPQQWHFLHTSTWGSKQKLSCTVFAGPPVSFLTPICHSSRHTGCSSLFTHTHHSSIRASEANTAIYCEVKMGERTPHTIYIYICFYDERGVCGSTPTHLFITHILSRIMYRYTFRDVYARTITADCFTMPFHRGCHAFS